MPAEKTLLVLFAGGGGATTGTEQYCKEHNIPLRIIAINHDAHAIATHKANHPTAIHYESDVMSTDPLSIVPDGKVWLLDASPECTYHSPAAGGLPVNDQSRETAWGVLHWLSALNNRLGGRVENFRIENVPEFRQWGPLMDKKVSRTITFRTPLPAFALFFAKQSRRGGTEKEWRKIYKDLSARAFLPGKHKLTFVITVRLPDPKQKGKIFLAYIAALEALGYTVRYKMIVSADFGGATSRKRLFILGKWGSTPPTFPEPTHSKTGEKTLFGAKPKWRGAEEIIDWSLRGRSIFDPSYKLVENTYRRIFAGLEKFSGGAFVISVAHSGANGSMVFSLKRPLSTITTRHEHALVEPYIVSLHGTAADQLDHAAAPVSEPLSAIATSGKHHSLVQPYILQNRGGNDPYTRAVPVSEPTQAITSHPAMALVEPFLINLDHSAGPDHQHIKPLSTPLATQTSADATALVQSYLIGQQSGAHPSSTRQPVPAIATRGAIGLAQPYIISYHGGEHAAARHASTLDPLNTIDTSNRFALCEPYLCGYHKNGENVSDIHSPLPTQTTHDRYALVIPHMDGDLLLDITYRMLQPHELAAAMGFPKTYKFVGTREHKVKQIGNAVSVEDSYALTGSLFP